MDGIFRIEKKPATEAATETDAGVQERLGENRRLKNFTDCPQVLREMIP
jgi:hypothetical protein